PVYQAIAKRIGPLRPYLSASVPAPMPPIIRKNSVTVASAPASARLISKLRRMSVRTKVMIVKSKASSVQAANVVRNVFHSWRETSLYQGIGVILDEGSGE